MYSTLFPDYEVHNVPYDGSCLFSAIAHQLYINNYFCEIPLPSGASVRSSVVNFIKSNPQLRTVIAERLVNTDIDKYLNDMASSKEWGDENMTYAASLFYDVQICIMSVGNNAIYVGSSNSGRTLTLAHVSCADGEGPTHYIRLIPRNRPSTGTGK